MLVSHLYPQRLLKQVKRRTTRFLSLVRRNKDVSADLGPSTLLDLLTQIASSYPHKGVKVYDGGLDAEPLIFSYPDLLAKARANGRKLRELGLVQPKQIVVLYSESHGPNVLWTWSIIAAGAVPAILSPLSNDEKTLAGQLENINNMFGGPLVLTPKITVEKFESCSGLRVLAIEEIELKCVPQKFKSNLQEAPASSSDLAVILFTSGSTGHSKGVEFTHEQLMESVFAKKEQHPINTNTTFMAWNSFDHSANFCEMHLSAMNVGADMLLLPSSEIVQQPERFFTFVSDHKIAYTFSPNFFLAIANKALNAMEPQPKLDFSNLKVLMTGGEATRTDVVAGTDEILRKYGAPEHTVKIAYGLSETCSAIFYGMRCPSYDQVMGYQFTSAGKHLPRGIELRIVDEQGNSVPYDSVGRIQLRGSIVFKRYHNNKTATTDCMTDDGWFDTGDLGYQDKFGDLIISGRKKEVLILNGNNYSSFELEHAIFNRAGSGVTQSYVATFSSWDESAQTEGIVVLFNPIDDIAENESELRKVIDRINKACVSFCSKYPVDVVPLPKMEMPRTTIGKLSRHKLKQSYLSGTFDQYKLAKVVKASSQALVGQRQLHIASIIAEKTGRPITTLGADSPIMNMGIDSLAYLRIKHELQKYLKLTVPIPLPLLLQADTIQDLDEALAKFQAENDADTDPNDLYEPLVVLRKTGKKLPLILCPPGGGEALNWISLVDHLPDRPIYALRARGLIMGERRFKDINEALDVYEKAIRTAQPTGPYALFGLCFGGILAFELAKRLEAQGDVVLFCGTIDAPPEHGLMEVRPAFKRFMLQFFAFHALITFDEAKRLEEVVYKDIDEEPEDFADRVFADFKGDAETVDLTRPKIRQWMHVVLGTVDMINKYRPTGRTSRFDCFIASEPPHESLQQEEWVERLRGWDKLAGSTAYYDITGNHFNALNHPHIESMQKELNFALARRGV